MESEIRPAGPWAVCTKAGEVIGPLLVNGKGKSFYLNSLGKMLAMPEDGSYVIKMVGEIKK